MWYFINSSGSVAVFIQVLFWKTHRRLDPFFTRKWLYLRYQVLDHQIVDNEGGAVVRVNDIQVAYIQVATL
jgi:hypothetical protein